MTNPFPGWYAGWMRTAGRTWQVIGSAPTEAGAWELLHVFAAGERMPDLCVLQTGIDPNERRRP